MFLAVPAQAGQPGVEALLAAHDWRGAACGDPAHWEPALRHAVRQMLDAAVPMFIVCAGGETFLYNDAYLPILGRRHPAALARPFAAVWPEVYPALAPAVAQVLAGQPVQFENAPFTITRNGAEEQSWFSFTYSPLRRLDGTVLGFACVVAETTERMREAEHLRREAGQISALFEGSTTFIAVLSGPDLVYQRANAAYMSLVGAREVIGLPLRLALPELVEQGYEAVLAGVLASGEAVAHRQTRVHLQRRPDAAPEPRVLDFSIQPLRDALGVISAVLVEGVDVTEHVEAEARAAHAAGLLRREQARLKALFEALGKSEARFRTMAEAMPQLVFALAAGTPDWFNERFLDFTGCTPAQLAADGWLGLVHPDDAGAVLPAWRRARDAAQAFDAEFRLRHRDGGHRWILGRALPVFGDDGRLLQWLGTFTDIDAQKRGEAALRDARLRLEGALTAAEVATWTWNMRENRVYADANLARLYGVSALDADGGPVEAYLAAVHPDDIAHVQARIERALASGEAFSDSYRLRDGAGGWRHVEARGKVSYGSDGQPEWLPGVALDVTAQRAAEAGLRRSETRFRRLAESNVLGIVEYRYDGALVAANDAFLAIVGVARADYEREGLNWRALTPPEWLESDARAWAQLRASGVMETFEKEFLRSDGSRAAVYLGAANFEGSQDEGLAYVLDISGIRAAERALKESEARFRVIANAMPQAVWSTRPDGFHDYYNDQWYSFTGMPYGSTDGDAWNGLFHPDDQTRAWDKWRHSLDTGAPYEIEYRLRHHSGSYRWVLGRALPVRAEDGTIVRWMGTCTDIHEQKLAQESLQEADRRKDEFLAMLAHELRNPLAPITTAASLLAMAAQDPARVRQVGTVISRQAAHMTGLIDDLMDVSRVTRGLVTLDRETVALAQVLDDAVEQVRPLLEGRAHRLEIRAAAAGIAVHGDRKRLVQVLANILGNAARYTPAGGHVVLTAGVEDGRALLAVRDNGIGMAPELVASAFELFHQGQRSPDRSQGGLGIGLALVRSLVQLHGGTVSAASEGEGRGSTFTVSLPLPEGAARGPAQDLDTAPQAAPGALRVLVVDDNTDAAELVAMFLQLLGYEVSVEFGAAGALERALRLKPQVCLLDIGLPGMDGKELARRLRRLPGLERVRLAAMTGYGQPHDRRASEEAGFDAHFVKPVETDALAAWLAERPA